MSEDRSRSASPAPLPVPTVAASGEENQQKASGKPSKEELKKNIYLKYLLVALRFIGVSVLLTAEVSIGICYIVLLSSLEFVLVLIYAAVYLGRFCRPRISFLLPVKKHAN
jgi:hypothetical protein